MSPHQALAAVTLPRGTAWAVFARERFQVPALLVLGAAQAASAQYVVSPTLDWAALAVSVWGIGALLVVLRLMDELKDIEKDRIAHPERPLPRGVISLPEARAGLRVGIAALLATSLLIAALRSPVAGALLTACVGYSILMYREFFLSDFLADRPFLYALSHQVVIIPLYAFATAAALPGRAFDPPVLWFGLTGLGASFALEVCRKLDPGAHPALGTYLSVAGPARTAAAVTAAAGLAAFAAYRLGLHAVVWPVALLLLGSLALTIARPTRFKVTAALAGLLVLAQVLAPTIGHFARVSP